MKIGHIILLVVILIVLGIAIVVGSKTEDQVKTTQEFFDESIHKSEVTCDGHDYYIFEYGTRHGAAGNYAFSMEHRLDCKECLKVFD